MKKSLSIIIVLASALPALCSPLRGDVNSDGAVNVTDVNLVVSDVLAGLNSAIYDINGDGVVNVTDVNLVVSITLNPKLALTGYEYVWDETSLPEIHLTVSLDEWNRLLQLYDANSHTKQYIMGQAEFIKDGVPTFIDSIGIRLKGNTSRRRPEGTYGSMHVAGETDWHHVHFGINLRKYCKDDEHTIQGVRKLHLKWAKDDPTYIREVYCYDLFRRFGVWTGPDDIHCRLWLRVEGDPQETYYGVYEMIEPIDENFLKRRNDEAHFGTHKGNLWKCRYAGGTAGLKETYSGDYWYDDDSDDTHAYTLQTNTKRFENAKAQMIDFQLKLNGKSRDSFYQWIQQVCDVDFLLRTYAVNVAVGMWDDYWNNSNNYYFYFTTEDIYDYKIYFIPYDYDNTLGTSIQCGAQNDAGRQDPLHWGVDGNPLIKRILEYDDFRAIYVGYLKEIVAEESQMFHFNASNPRIYKWRQKIEEYVANDTGEDMEIEDKPASWGAHWRYRLYEDGPYNFFRVKTETINNMP